MPTTARTKIGPVKNSPLYTCNVWSRLSLVGTVFRAAVEKKFQPYSIEDFKIDGRTQFLVYHVSFAPHSTRNLTLNSWETGHPNSRAQAREELKAYIISVIFSVVLCFCSAAKSNVQYLATYATFFSVTRTCVHPVLASDICNCFLSSGRDLKTRIALRQNFDNPSTI
jgi:hypothetical protein